MTTGYVLTEITEWTPERLAPLAPLLIDTVADGASIGFLPPLSEADALDYWLNVGGAGVRLWVIHVEERPVATVQLHLAQRQNGSHRAEIAKLMVHPTARRQGFARLLMETAEQCARKEGRTLLVLDTRTGDPSNYLYQSLGYIEAGTIPQYARSASGTLDATTFYYKILDDTTR